MYLFFDTETNGLPKRWGAPMTDLNNYPRIIQLAWALVSEDGEIINERKELIKPDGWVIPNEKFWIDNGYNTLINAADGLPMDEVLDDFIQDLQEADLMVAHNMAFDYPVTGAEMIRYKKKSAKKVKQFCTMKTSTPICNIPHANGRGVKFPKLEEAHQFFLGEGFEGAHDAGNDVQACINVFFKLKELGHVQDR